MAYVHGEGTRQSWIALSAPGRDKRRVMINGAHVVIYSKKPDLDRAFLQDVLGLPHVEVGGGWLIFALPPSEVAVHPGSKNGVHELYLTCDDVKAFVTAVGKRGVRCGAVKDQGWGLLTTLRLPGGGELGVYEARHARPNGKPGSAKPGSAKPSKNAPKTAARKLAKRAVKRARR